MQEIKIDNCVIRITRPELTDEERRKRMQAIHNAAANLLKGVQHEKGD